MIRFSKREDYSVILVHKLAQEYNKRLVPISEIAQEYEISLLFLRNLARDLRTAGLIKAIEGKNGGYYLTKNPKEILLGDILKVFAKDTLLECCPANMKNGKPRTCPKKGHCVTGNIWRELNKEFIDKVYKLTLTDFMEHAK
jgi:Rrf2 family iron-sulfur cluster assembly transcriptional regulator